MFLQALVTLRCVDVLHVLDRHFRTYLPAPNEVPLFAATMPVISTVQVHAVHGSLHHVPSQGRIHAPAPQEPQQPLPSASPSHKTWNFDPMTLVYVPLVALMTPFISLLALTALVLGLSKSAIDRVKMLRS